VSKILQLMTEDATKRWLCNVHAAIPISRLLQLFEWVTPVFQHGTA